MSQKIENPPAADILMNSMRSIGYSFSAAVADIIDNSISANARNIDLIVSPEQTNIYLAFLDDGNGMAQDELKEAMKYGSQTQITRASTDLGRFGLGLKSASLSQCTKLTVVSKKNGLLSAFVWDLELVKETKKWTILELSQDEISKLPCIERLGSQEKGTLVIWTDFDIIRETNNGLEYEGLTDCIYEACDFIGLIFHRFILNGTVNIRINGTEIEPIDPFLESNKKTEVGKSNDITIDDDNGVQQHITVTTYLLPYLKDLSDSDKKKLGGVSKISTMQGFYVYRNDRLIIYGTWFHMSYRNELAKYARIKVDIPSALDSIWKIDIKKQTAELPPLIRKQLQKCVESANFSSRRKNEHRLTLKTNDPNCLWQKNLTRENKAVYKINRDSPFIRSILQSIEPNESYKIGLLLDAIEYSIPYHDMYTDEANDNIETELTEEDKEQLSLAAFTLIKQKEQIESKPFEQMVDDILSIDPFRQYDWLKERLLKEHSNE